MFTLLDVAGVPGFDCEAESKRREDGPFAGHLEFACCFVRWQHVIADFRKGVVLRWLGNSPQVGIKWFPQEWRPQKFSGLSPAVLWAARIGPPDALTSPVPRFPRTGAGL